MADFNKVIFLGRITREPEMKYTQGGTAICKFGMVSNRKSGKGDDKKEESCFVDVVAFGKTGEVIANYCEKGGHLLIEGRLQFSTWEKEGRKNSKLEVVAENVQLMPRGGGGGGGGRRKTGAGESGERVPLGDTDRQAAFDSIPF